MNLIVPQETGFSHEQERLIAQYLNDEEVIVYPTDTLYGLGAKATSSNAVARLYALKQRQDAPVSVLVADVESMLSMCQSLSQQAERMIRTFLPGALTVVSYADYPFAEQLYSQRKTIGFRVPADGISTQIPYLLDAPITTTSVNPAGMKPASSASEVLEYYDGQVPCMIDIGPFPESRGSTVIDVTTWPFRILREGEITRHALEDFLN